MHSLPTITDHIEQAKKFAKAKAVQELTSRIICTGSLSTKEEAKLRVKCDSICADFDEEFTRIIARPNDYALTLAEIVKNPTKQNIHEKMQLQWLGHVLARVAPTAQWFQPKGGARIGFNESGQVGAVALGTKDFDVKIDGLSSKPIFGSVKYITARGGAQDHQKNELGNAMKLAAKNTDITFIGIIDGHARATYISALKCYETDHVFVIDSEGLEPLLERLM